eukprot:XP_765574.1 hypothetical protein [Theileria parva strain Muguga]
MFSASIFVSIDAQELKKIDDKIRKEEAEEAKDHGRGMNYKGSCDSRQSFKWFSVDQKRDIVSLIVV